MDTDTEGKVADVPGFARRLRAERKRLGLRQSDFCKLGGVQPGSQHNYEAGKQAPTIGYFIELAKTEVDVNYIITGERNQKLLSVEASELLDLYMMMEPDMRFIILQTARLLSKPTTRSTLHEKRASYRAEGESDDNDEDF